MASPFPPVRSVDPAVDTINHAAFDADMGVFPWIAAIARWVDRRMTRKVARARMAHEATPYPKSHQASDHWWGDGCDTFDHLHP